METKRPVGRPRFDGPPQFPRRILLDEERWQLARRIGGGNVSAGIRLALDEHRKLARSNR